MLGPSLNRTNISRVQHRCRELHTTQKHGLVDVLRLRDRVMNTNIWLVWKHIKGKKHSREGAIIIQARHTIILQRRDKGTVGDVCVTLLDDTS